MRVRTPARCPLTLKRILVTKIQETQENRFANPQNSGFKQLLSSADR